MRQKLRLLLALFGLVAGAAPVPAASAATELSLAPGEPFTADHAERLLGERLGRPEAARTLRLAFTRPRLPLGNPYEEPVRISVEHLDHGKGDDTFEASLALHAGDTPPQPFLVRGRTIATVEVPVPVRNIAAGERLGPADVVLEPIAERRLGPDVLRDIDALVGQEARRRLVAERPVRERDLGAPRLVRRGDTVRMVYSRAGLLLVAMGKAIEDGGRGDEIAVINTSTRRELRAVVANADEVRVEPLQ